MNVYLDLETTSTNVYSAQIIELYAIDDNGREIHFYAKPNISEQDYQDSYKVHGISYRSSQAFPPVAEGLRELLRWLPKASEGDFDFVCFANQNTPLGHITYDVAVIRWQIELLIPKTLEYFNWFDRNYDYDIISVHALAKQMHYDRLIKIPKPSKESGIKQFSQENIAKCLDIKYKSHRAKDDVIAMIKIYNKLKVINENRVEMDNGISRLI